MDLGRLMLGIVFLVLGLMILSLESAPKIEYGAVVMIGPVPILVASDVGLALFLILISAFLLALVYLLRWWK
ncbi:MAG: DUF131 domain-containing protein [Archaeoglobaceae archaeon]|nr:DUF131 domain-containing protein [Archaeoglobaceae archaeon]MDW8117803.1 DUF131 domain-containing protein [Archaeoglobaceae archaeon]